MKNICVAFFCLKYRFIIFWRKKIGCKAALEMLVKLTPDEDTTPCHLKKKKKKRKCNIRKRVEPVKKKEPMYG